MTKSSDGPDRGRRLRWASTSNQTPRGAHFIFVAWNQDRPVLGTSLGTPSSCTLYGNQKKTSRDGLGELERTSAILQINPDLHSYLQLVITSTCLKMLRCAWHMSCQLQVQLGAFHSGQSASAPMTGPDQIVPRNCIVRRPSAPHGLSFLSVVKTRFFGQKVTVEGIHAESSQLQCEPKFGVS